MRLFGSFRLLLKIGGGFVCCGRFRRVLLTRLGFWLAFLVLVLRLVVFLAGFRSYVYVGG